MDDIQTTSFDIVSPSTIEPKIIEAPILAIEPDAPTKAQTETIIDKHLEEINNQRSALAYSEPEYYIIAGSFKDEANALQYMTKPIFNIVPAQLVYMDNLYRISVGQYDAKQTARIKLAELRTRNRELKDAWVYTNK